jgi:2-polyprenyl-3-methyl-5-hydroxy-6-metoxy-1,4-benzoquinol methylase
MLKPGGISYEYNATNHEVSHGYLKPVIDNLVSSFPAGTLVLDMGCGNGNFISLYRDRGWTLHGTDFSTSGIEIAKANFPDISFVLADSQTSTDELLDRMGRMDLIISTEVVEMTQERSCVPLTPSCGRGGR